MKMTLEKTALGTIESGDRIRRCVNEVYRGKYINGPYKGTQVILKYTQLPDAEAKLIQAVSEAGVETPRVLEWGKSFAGKEYIVIEYKDMQNLSYYTDKISTEKIANNLASFHAKLYNNRANLEDRVIKKMTEKDRTLEKCSRITKEPAIYRAALALWSAFTSSVSMYQFDKYIDKLSSQLPDRECLGHRDQSVENILTDGENLNFIDFTWLGESCFATDVAKLALCLKSEGPFDEQAFVEAYYTELDRQIGSKIHKTKEQFLKEYKAAKILVGISFATVYTNCKSDPNRQSVSGRIDTFVHSAFDEMNNKERNTVLSMLSNNDNKYSRDILKSANRWRKHNQSRARVWLDNQKRRIFRHLTPLHITAAGLIFAATIAYGHYKYDQFIKENPTYAAKAAQLQKQIDELDDTLEDFDRVMKKIDNHFEELERQRKNSADPSDEELYKSIEDKLK